jgi:hypothetical protein
MAESATAPATLTPQGSANSFSDNACMDLGKPGLKSQTTTSRVSGPHEHSLDCLFTEPAQRRVTPDGDPQSVGSLARTIFRITWRMRSLLSAVSSSRASREGLAQAPSLLWDPRRDVWREPVEADDLDGPQADR